MTSTTLFQVSLFTRKKKMPKKPQTIQKAPQVEFINFKPNEQQKKAIKAVAKEWADDMSQLVLMMVEKQLKVSISDDIDRECFIVSVTQKWQGGPHGAYCCVCRHRNLTMALKMAVWFSIIEGENLDWAQIAQQTSEYDW
jgi:hypothetical protein